MVCDENKNEKRTLHIRDNSYMYWQCCAKRVKLFTNYTVRRDRGGAYKQLVSAVDWVKLWFLIYNRDAIILYVGLLLFDEPFFRARHQNGD